MAALIAALAITATAIIAPVAASTPHALSPSPSPSPSASAAAVRLDQGMQLRFRLNSSPQHPIVPNADNYAARTIPVSPLLLFLAATGHRPAQYRDFLATARDRGYHVLALDYWNNGASVAQTCGTNATCYTAVQRNRLDGSDPSPVSSVDPANSIVSRLHAALRHLASVDAAGRWSQFLPGGVIDWADIVLAGHSQGGGESAYISHIHAVRGVLMFASPVDSDHGVNASWMASPGATPASRMYGFDDASDIFGPRIVASWNALGMGAFGAVANADAAIPAGSHELVTHRDLGTPVDAHVRTITDGAPLVGGKPVFAPVWNWMLAQLYPGPSQAAPDEAADHSAPAGA